MFTNQVNDLNPVQSARAHMIQDAPFYASIALKLLLREVGIAEGQRTLSPVYGGLATDGKEIIWAQELMDRKTPEEIKGLIIHEVFHVLLKHHFRRGERQAILWNVAGDMVVNLLCHQEGFSMGNDSICTYEQGLEFITQVCPGLKLTTNRKPTETTGEPSEKTSTEEVYENLVALMQKQQKKQKSSQNAQGQKGQGNGTPQPGGTPGEGEPGDGQSIPGLEGQVLDHPGETTEELQQAELDLDTEIAQAVYAASARGLLPGHAKHLLDKVTRAKVDWKEQLRAWFSSRSIDDFSYSKQNRRYAGCNIIMPVMESTGTLNIAIAVDTSGSVSDAELNQYLGEISGIIEDCRADVLFIQCDAAVNYAEHLDRDDLPLSVTIHGRGGTDYEPVFAYLREQEESLDGLIYLTDGECNYENIQVPDYPVLWVYSRNPFNGYGQGVAPFGTYTIIEV